MNISIVPRDGALEALTQLFEWAGQVELAYAWASSAKGTAAHWKAMDLTKIQRAVIGTQFAQTEPWVLAELKEKAQGLRVVITSEGTFHPKLVWGERGSKFRALIGSSNLTVGGFSSNTELNVLIEGKLSDPQASAIHEFLADAWQKGVELDDSWLARYTEAHRNRPLSVGVVPGAPVEGETLASLDISWPTYVRVLRGSEGAQLKGDNRLRLLDADRSYFWELDQAQDIFRNSSQFAGMNVAEQYFVLGRGATTGYFGHMGASFATGKAIRERAHEIGAVLDEIPLTGEIYDRAEAYVRRLMDIHGFGLAVATRVLCVKRPDVFVSVNDANSGAFERLGFPVGKRISRYMDLLRAVWNSEWYRSAKPVDPIEQRLWKARAAILDAAVYRG